VYIRTGTETSPKETTPDQIARGTLALFHRFRADKRGFTRISPGEKTPELLHLTGG
jgi:hypothetical protein